VGRAKAVRLPANELQGKAMPGRVIAKGLPPNPRGPMTTSLRFIDDFQGGMPRMKDTVRLTLLSVSTIKRQVKPGRFSPPVSLEGRSVG